MHTCHIDKEERSITVHLAFCLCRFAHPGYNLAESRMPLLSCFQVACCNNKHACTSVLPAWQWLASDLHEITSRSRSPVCLHAGDDISGPLTHSIGEPSPGNEDSDDPSSDPADTAIHLNLARAQQQAGQHEQAAQGYRALEQAGALQGYPEELCGYAGALSGTEDWRGAERLLRQVIEDEDTPRKVSS